MAFEKGRSGNPEGRKPGAPNRLTKAVREQIASGSDPIAVLQGIMDGKPMEYEAGDGSPGTAWPTLEQRVRAAVKLADKLSPDAKDNPVSFKVPKIEKLEDALTAMAAVVDAMCAGELTPSEAGNVQTVIGNYVKAYEATDLERRIRELEEAKA